MVDVTKVCVPGERSSFNLPMFSFGVSLAYWQGIVLLFPRVFLRASLGSRPAPWIAFELFAAIQDNQSLFPLPLPITFCPHPLRALTEIRTPASVIFSAVFFALQVVPEFCLS